MWRKFFDRVNHDVLMVEFTFRGTKLRWADQAFADFKHNVRKLTGRSWGVSMAYRLDRPVRYVRGWMNWLLDSGRGQFGYVDLERGVFEPVAFCAGYARGLAFHGDYAIVGISRARENRTFSGLALDEALLAKGAEARTGVLVIDLRTGDVPHWLRITGVIAELYDVVALSGAVRCGGLL